MPYPKKLLNDNETVALDLHPHWWYFAKAAAWLVLAIAIGILSLILDDGTFRDIVRWAALIGIVVSAILLVKRYIQWSTINFVITSDRIIYRSGVFAKRGIEIPVERVNNVLFEQSIIERMLGAGNLLIESGGETGQQRFTDIKNPERVQNLIHTQVDAKVIRRSGGGGGGATPATDVATQLEKLEGLAQRGAISPEEYEAQKRKLLG